MLRLRLLLPNIALVLLLTNSQAQAETCLDCHEGSGGSAAHILLQGKHGKTDEACETCHGPSQEHMQRPTISSPDISFGPRWTATVAQQDEQCLNCHQANVAAHWRDALHMANNVTCVSCHDLHVAEDRVLKPREQAAVCTTCHKTQKSGIHGKERMARMNPPCTTCHNPHADQRPEAVMLENDSAGCRRCHNLTAMDKSDKVSAKAKTYHRALPGQQMSCLACHDGVAHGSTDAVEPFKALSRSSKEITLFSPGQSDSQWILTAHPGAQPLRQGAPCQQCHRGDEAEMGAKLSKVDPTARTVKLSFLAEDDRLITQLTWQGSADDTRVSMMWGFGGNEPFRRGGCWAACHGDMPGMSMDRGAGIDKYLWASRQQMRRIGQQAVIKTEAELNAEMDAGNFVELWQLELSNGGKARVATLLANTTWLKNSPLVVKTSFSDGQWTAEIIRPMRPDSPLSEIVPGKRYTFGLAMHGKDHAGAAHWVSLPTTLSLDGDDTDFITR